MFLMFEIFACNLNQDKNDTFRNKIDNTDSNVSINITTTNYEHIDFLNFYIYPELQAVRIAPKTEEEAFKPKYVVVPVHFEFIPFVINKDNRAMNNVFKTFWETEWDWFINGSLYYYFSIDPSPVMKYFPSNVENWRNERKEQDYLFWIDYFDTLSG